MITPVTEEEIVREILQLGSMMTPAEAMALDWLASKPKTNSPPPERHVLQQLHSVGLVCREGRQYHLLPKGRRVLGFLKEKAMKQCG